MPIFTYRCPQGHEWDEFRSIAGAEVSEDPCPTCMEADEREPGHEPARGRRVPPSTAPAAHFRGRGWTPHHYPGRAGK